MGSLVRMTDCGIAWKTERKTSRRATVHPSGFFFEESFQKSFFPQVIPQSRVPEVFVVGKLIMFNNRVFPSREYHLNNYPAQLRGISPHTTAELAKIRISRKIEQNNCFIIQHTD